jgi:serpin B
MFTGAADFSGISDVPLMVDKAVHQAALQLDEKGAEGAAATVVIMSRAAFSRPEPVRFWVDRSFLAILRHRPTGVVYFIARITNP